MSETKIINIDSITVNSRIRKTFNNIETLAESIKDNELLTPLTVRQVDENGKYILLAGERRLRALKMLNITEIPVTIIKTDSDIENLLIEIRENCEREGFLREEEVYAGEKLEEIFQSEALERKRAGQKIIESDTKGRTVDLVAKELRIGSGKQYTKHKFIVANKACLDEDMYQKWNNREISTDKAYKAIKAAQNISQPQNDKTTEYKNNLIHCKNRFGKLKEQSQEIFTFIDNIEEIWDSQGSDVKDTMLSRELEAYKKALHELSEIIDNIKYDENQKVYVIDI